MVRKFILGMGLLAVANPAYAGPLGSSGSMDKIDPAKGEVLLEVKGNGVSVQKGVRFSSSCEIGAKGKSVNEAKAELTKKQNALRAALPGAQVDAALPPTKGRSWDVVDVAEEVAPAAADATEKKEPEPVFYYKQDIGVTVTSVAKYYEIQSVLEEHECSDNDYRRTPKIEIADPKAAKDDALRDALNKARAQAETYAAAMNLKVLRPLRVSEVGAMSELFGGEYSEMMSEMQSSFNRGKPITGDVSITAWVSVDYVLGPK